MLEIKKLRAGYDGRAVLNNVSANLSAGEFTAVIGPNGCGKSTLIKCAAGLLHPMSGEILLNHAVLSAIPIRERAKSIAYMPQIRLTPEISVRMLALHGRYPHLKWGQNPSPADWEIVEAAIHRVELTHLADKPLNCISGGERQRAYIAMMLTQQTPVLLLDEPAAHLDLSARFSLMRLLKELASEGRCVCAVLHDLSLALEFADRILLMQGGSIAAQSSPAEICASGQISRVFGVNLRRTESGKTIFYPAFPAE